MLGAFAHAGNLDTLAQWLIVALGVPLMFWAARRPYVRPLTAAEKEADFQATKAAFHGGPPDDTYWRNLDTIADTKRGRWPPDMSGHGVGHN